MPSPAPPAGWAAAAADRPPQQQQQHQHLKQQHLQSGGAATPTSSGATNSSSGASSATCTVAAALGLSPAWQHNHPIGAGLNNLGNSCFLNAVLQALAYLPPLGNLCLARAHRRVCTLAPGCICCKLEEQVARLLTRATGGGSSGFGFGGYGGSGAGPADTPDALHRALPALSRSFVRGRQEDAHELLRCLVDALERDLLRLEGRWAPGGRRLQVRGGGCGDPLAAWVGQGFRQRPPLLTPNPPTHDHPPPHPTIIAATQSPVPRHPGQRPLPGRRRQPGHVLVLRPQQPHLRPDPGPLPGHRRRRVCGGGAAGVHGAGAPVRRQRLQVGALLGGGELRCLCI
jgi:hypothetical protein